MSHISFISSIIYRVRNFFSFSSPKILHLEYIDWIIEDKPTFYFSWRFKEKYFLHIKQLRRKYLQKSGTVLLNVSPYLNYLDIVITRGWRKIRIRINLKKIHLDKKTLRELDNHFRPNNYSILFNSTCSIVKNKISAAKFKCITIKKSNLDVKNQRISLKSELLNYTNETL